VPLVVLSGFGDNGTGSAAVTAGAQDYLVKGHVDGELISRAIRYAIDRHQRETAAAAAEAGRGAPPAHGGGVTQVTGLDGVVRYAPPSARDWLGSDPDRLVGTSFFDLVHPDDAALVTGSFMSGRLRDHGCRLRRPDGSWRTVAASATTLPGDAAPKVVLNLRIPAPAGRTDGHSPVLT
jgi:PAS domain-containing protein